MTDKPLVLIAEDDAGVRMTLEFVLADEGFEVLSAEDGEQALSLALERSPDAILLDGRMPKLTGKQVLTALRALRATAETPVFVLTGMDPAFENEGGADAEWPGAHFIGKPFDPDELVEGIRRVLDAQR
ncbi:MAG TPA: response regulator [Actinomycetota bacterium]|jgi:DNA-binding response OmpR family regulator|nr:response regulator [Actinomycetota bacterium]